MISKNGWIIKDSNNPELLVTIQPFIYTIQPNFVFDPLFLKVYLLK
jgi:hypothetical protein